ncbi:hypothetical protein FKP32DRAFT_590281 [Trametes sanguinea]|nr:hypothetical protein FKP32DRAFT_590281 [Trametes sanguinea]
MASDTASKAPSPGPSPFDQPSADIILRTSDLVDFRVHSPILIQASPFFATMLSLPQPRPQRSDVKSEGASSDATAPQAVPDSDSVPVVDVSEDSATLELILRILYPIPKPKMDRPDMLVSALRLARKYEMEWPKEILSERLVDVLRTPKMAIHVWAAACRTNLEDVARQAAVVLRVSRSDGKPTTGSPEEGASSLSPPAALACVAELGKMEGICAGDYFRLERFLRADQAQVDGGSLKLLTPLPEEVKPRRPSAWKSFFTDIPFTDVLCRSASHNGHVAEFAAHQIILSVQSPLMKARLAKLHLANARTHAASTELKYETKQTQPELTFDMDPNTLAALLNVCYGGASSLPIDLDEIARLVVAADDSDFQVVALRARGRWDLRARIDPVSAYLVAMAHGLIFEAREAAQLVLRRGFADFGYVEALEGSSALAYHSLLRYRDSCRELIRERVVAAANTVSECRIAIFTPRSTALLEFKGVGDALRRPEVLTDRLIPGSNLSKAVQTALAESLEENRAKNCWGTGWRSELCNFMNATLKMVVDLPDKIDEDIDGVKLFRE